MTYRRTLFLVSCCLPVVLSLSACAGSDQTANNAGATATAPPAASSPASTESASKAPTADVVRAGAEALEIRAGGAAEASVRLDIADGYHINANPPTHDYLIPTQIDILPAEGFKAGKPVYPQALTKKFAFDPQPLAVYEKEATIRLPLRADASAAKGAHTLRAKIRVQPCDDEACYPPRNVEASIALTVN